MTKCFQEKDRSSVSSKKLELKFKVDVKDVNENRLRYTPLLLVMAPSMDEVEGNLNEKFEEIYAFLAESGVSEKR